MFSVNITTLKAYLESKNIRNADVEFTRSSMSLSIENFDGLHLFINLTKNGKQIKRILYDYKEIEIGNIPTDLKIFIDYLINTPKPFGKF